MGLPLAQANLHNKGGVQGEWLGCNIRCTAAAIWARPTHCVRNKCASCCACSSPALLQACCSALWNGNLHTMLINRARAHCEAIRRNCRFSLCSRIAFDAWICAPSMLFFFMALKALSFSAFSFFSHFAACLLSCLAWNFRLNTISNILLFIIASAKPTELQQARVDNEHQKVGAWGTRQVAEACAS